MKAISSVYGFILIFLLSMASIQTWSSAVGAMESIQGASDQSHQLQQLQGIEHLSLSKTDGNLTVTNDGQVPSTLEFLRLVGQNSSRTVEVDAPVAVGQSVVEPVPAGYAVEAVTSLGNVFVLSPSSAPIGAVWSGALSASGNRNEQLFDNPYDPTSFYVSSGSWVYAFDDSGVPLWSFDAGIGTVTDVMPIAVGDVYVAVGYGAPSNAGYFDELGPDGRLIASFPVRVLDSPDVTISVPIQPVNKGGDLGYAFYDGWFYSEAGPTTSLSVQGVMLAGSDASSFYFYSPLGGASYGNCEPWGNEVTLQSFSPGQQYSGGLQFNWTAFAYLGPCTRYDSQFLGASIGGGALAALFGSVYYSDSYLQALPGYNPYLAVVSTSGQILFDGETPSDGYSAVATDGSSVYLALPQLDQVQALSLSTQSFATYGVGFPASSLICEHGFLFAISPSEVKVYDGAMDLVKTINLAPLELSSASNSLPFEPALQAPSFLVLNGTSYAVLAQNSTGYSTLLVGDYA